MMRIVRFVMIISTCLLYPFEINEALGDQYGHDGHLVIWIKAEKAKYNLGEPIIVNFTLSNFTTVPLTVNKRLHPTDDLKWDLFYDGFGLIRTNSFPFETLKDEDFVRLEVNEEIHHVLPDLHEIAAQTLNPGRYALRLAYANESKPSGKGTSLEGETWTGVVVTNQLWIEIKTAEKI